MVLQGFELLLPDEVEVFLRHETALARHGGDEAFGLQLVIGPLCGDDRNFQVLCQSPDGGQRLPRLQRPGDDLGLDLGADLVVDRLARGISDDEFHGIPPFVLYMYSIYSMNGLSRGEMKFLFLSPL